MRALTKVSHHVILVGNAFLFENVLLRILKARLVVAEA